MLQDLYLWQRHLRAMQCSSGFIGGVLVARGIKDYMCRVCVCSRSVSHNLQGLGENNIFVYTENNRSAVSEKLLHIALLVL